MIDVKRWKTLNTSRHLVVQTAWLCRSTMELAHSILLKPKVLVQVRARCLREHEVVPEMVGALPLRGTDYEGYLGSSACSRGRMANPCSCHRILLSQVDGWPWPQPAARVFPTAFRSGLSRRISRLRFFMRLCLPSVPVDVIACVCVFLFCLSQHAVFARVSDHGLQKNHNFQHLFFRSTAAAALTASLHGCTASYVRIPSRHIFPASFAGGLL